MSMLVQCGCRMDCVGGSTYEVSTDAGGIIKQERYSTMIKVIHFLAVQIT